MAARITLKPPTTATAARQTTARTRTRTHTRTRIRAHSRPDDGGRAAAATQQRVVTSRAKRDPSAVAAAEPNDATEDKVMGEHKKKKPAGGMRIDISTLRLEDLDAEELVSLDGLAGLEVAQVLHDRAQELGLDGYIDPPSGYSVLTADNLRRRPCCQGGCRHCPYGFKLT